MKNQVKTLTRPGFTEVKQEMENRNKKKAFLMKSKFVF